MINIQWFDAITRALSVNCEQFLTQAKRQAKTKTATVRPIFMQGQKRFVAYNIEHLLYIFFFQRIDYQLSWVYHYNYERCLMGLLMEASM